MVGDVLKKIFEGDDIMFLIIAGLVVICLIIIIFTTIVVHVIKESGIIDLIKNLNGKEKNDKGKNLKIEGIVEGKTPESQGPGNS